MTQLTEKGIWPPLRSAAELRRAREEYQRVQRIQRTGRGEPQPRPRVFAQGEAAREAGAAARRRLLAGLLIWFAATLAGAALGALLLATGIVR